MHPWLHTIKCFFEKDRSVLWGSSKPYVCMLMQLLSHVQLQPRTCSFLKSVMPSNHLILCHPLLLLPSIFPSMRVFSNESVLCIRRPVQCWQHSQGKRIRNKWNVRHLNSHFLSKNIISNFSLFQTQRNFLITRTYPSANVEQTWKRIHLEKLH